MRRSAAGSSRALSRAVDGDLGRVGFDVVVLLKPACELAGDRPRGLEQLLAGAHLADHEIAEELAEVRRDLRRSEQLAERVLVPGVERLLPPLGIPGVQRRIRVAVQAVAQQPDHVLVVAIRPIRQARALVTQERVERLIDRHRVRHREAQSIPAS